MDKIPYRVREGVDWINGARVPADRLVDLTEAEARYDRALGRIVAVASEADKPPAASPDEDAPPADSKKRRGKAAAAPNAEEDGDA